MGFTVLWAFGDLAPSRDFSHIEDLWKPPINPRSQRVKHGKYWREGENAREREMSHTLTLTLHSEAETHHRRADYGSKLAQLSTPPQCSHGLYAGRGRVDA